MKSNSLRAALIALLFLSLGVRPQEHAFAQEATPLEYTVNLNDRTGDTFKVTLSVDDLGPENAVYQFASTAPAQWTRVKE